LEGFYESDEYRKGVDAASGIEDFRKLHDASSLQWLGLMDGSLLRNAVIADIGCGGGSFVDAVKGYAKSIVAIEPMATYRSALEAEGFHVYPYTADAQGDWAQRVDVACCFSVLEHVVNPVKLLKDTRRLLRPGGVLYASTPNREEILMRLRIPEFLSFYYRLHHVHYFNSHSLQIAANMAGFREVDIVPFHRYGFMNTANWLEQRRPTGDPKSPALGPDLDRAWKAMLEQNGLADYLWFRCSY
jgi:2-polyprenyl-3-methyl-5-hydroxy-6-metoxy-1,4-benzoquinol methylase